MHPCPGSRICGECGESHSRLVKGRLASYCHDCQRRYIKAWRTKDRRAAIRQRLAKRGFVLPETP